MSEPAPEPAEMWVPEMARAQSPVGISDGSWPEPSRAMQTAGLRDPQGDAFWQSALTAHAVLSTHWGRSADQAHTGPLGGG